MVLVLTVIRQPDGCMAPEMRKVFGSEGGTIGRSSDNSWQLPDTKRFVSSMHGFIRCDAGRFFLVDTSSNGIYVNDDAHPIGPGKKVRLNDGDRFFIGEYEIKVELDANAALAPGPSVPPAVRVPESAMALGESRSVRRTAAKDLLQSAVGDGEEALPGGKRAPRNVSAGMAEDLMRALGLDPENMDPTQRSQFSRTVAEWILEATQGTIDALSQRNALRQQFRLNATTIKSSENNPLKFSVTAEEAVRHMFAPSGEAYIAGPAAVREAMTDLMNHQRAVTSAMRAAFNHMFLCLDPQQLEQRFVRGAQKQAFLQSKKSYLWDTFVSQYDDWKANPDQAFRDLFGENFAENYEEHMDMSELSRKR